MTILMLLHKLEEFKKNRPNSMNLPVYDSHDQEISLIVEHIQDGNKRPYIELK